MVEALATFTNKYARLHIANKQHSADKHGAWIPTNGAEMLRLLAMLIFMSIVKLPRLSNYMGNYINLSRQLGMSNYTNIPKIQGPDGIPSCVSP